MNMGKGKTPTFRAPRPVRKVCMIFKFSDGKEIRCFDIEEAKTVHEYFLRLEASMDKKNGFIVLKDEVIFMENVDSIKFYLESEVF